MKIQNVVLLTLNALNKNNRVYTTEVIQQMLDNHGEQPIMGTFGNIDSYFHIDVSKISHRVDNVRIEGDNLIGDVTVLKTPTGGNLLDVLSLSHDTYGFRPRMTGLYDVQDGVPHITECKLISIDFVQNPA